jgi:hypothetical protein
MFFEEIGRMSSGDFLNVEPSCNVFNRISEGYGRIISVNQKYFRNISVSQRPSLFPGMELEDFKSNFSSIHADALPYRLNHCFNNSLCFRRRKVKSFLEIIRKTRHTWIVAIFRKRGIIAFSRREYILSPCSQAQISQFCHASIS